MSSLASEFPGNVIINGEIITASIPGTWSKYQDLFNRIRISNPSTIFESNFYYTNDPLRWDTFGTGSASNPVHGTVILTASAGQTVVRQTKQYITYLPGKSTLILISGVLADSMTNGTISRIGCFDDKNNKTGVAPDTNEGNGHFFQAKKVDGIITYYVVQRSSSITGVQEDIEILQTQWNKNKLDGNSNDIPSVSIDFTKTQIFVIEKAWLGVGSVRFGVVVEGNLLWFHQINNNNIIKTAYNSRGSLPIRCELNNTAGTGTATLKHICCSVHSEGGYDSCSLSFSANNKLPVSINVSSGAMLMLAIRLKNTRPRTNVIPMNFVVSGTLANANLSIVELHMNPTITGATWSSVNNNSSVEMTTTGTLNLSTSTVVACTTLSGGNSTATVKGFKVIPICTNYNGTVSDVLAVVAYLVSGSAYVPVNMSCCLTWDEIN